MQALQDKGPPQDPPRASKIWVLPPELADQIAAGEVVERPASVVKELCENALDAGAGRIEVEIDRGGLGLIRVTDDGCGMTEAEAELALLRHATSKLRRLEDLFSLSTMGFRGEALPSIAAVSRFQLTSRTREAPGATRLVVEGGVRKGPPAPASAQVGTQIEVRDLLFNVPARLKFMKGEATEAGHVSEAVLRLSLSFPQVHFRLRAGGREVLDLPPHTGRLERARAALRGRLRGRAAGELLDLYETRSEEAGVRVHALLGAPSEATTTPRNVYLLVGGRFIRDRSLLHAVSMGYGEQLGPGRYPMCVLHLDVPPDALDVNVHPQKLEVRFSRAQEVYAAVRHAIGKVALRAPWLAALDPSQRPRVYEIGGAGALPFPDEAGPAEAREEAAPYGAGERELDEGGRPGGAAGAGAAEGAWAQGSAPGGYDRLRPSDAGGLGGLPRGGSFPGPGPGGRAGSFGGGAGSFRGGGLGGSYGSGGRAGAGSSAELPPRAPGGLDEHRARLQQALRFQAPPLPDEAGAQPEAPPRRRFFSAMTYLGQYGRTYLLCEHERELVLIDQHAAHERLAFERLRRAQKDKDGAPLRSQRLLLPLQLELDPQRAAILEDESEALGALGFEVRPFGGRTFALQAVPDVALFGRGARTYQDPERLLNKVIDDFLEHGRSEAIEARIERVLATLACHSVVRAGDVLDEPRARALLDAMDEEEFHPHCPHGRPVLVRMPLGEIERRFGRT